MKPGERERNRARLWSAGGRVCLAGLAAGLLPAFAAPVALDTSALRRLDYEVIPLRRTQENHLFISGRVNGRRASCLVDTGWTFSTMKPGLAGANSSFARLELGGVHFTNLPVRVEKILFAGQPASFDLVLGLDFLRRHAALVDCGRRRLWIRRQPLAESGQRELATVLEAAGGRETPLTFRASTALTVAARVNDEPVELLVDTGAVWSCLDQRQVARLDLKARASAARLTGAGGTGIRPVAVAEVKSFQIGTAAFHPATLALLDLADWQLAATNQPLGEVQGILGGDWLMAMDAVIDCGAGRLWVRSAGRR